MRFDKILPSLVAWKIEVLWDVHPQDLAMNDGHVIRTLAISGNDEFRSDEILQDLVI